MNATVAMKKLGVSGKYFVSETNTDYFLNEHNQFLRDNDEFDTLDDCKEKILKKQTYKSIQTVSTYFLSHPSIFISNDLSMSLVSLSGVILILSPSNSQEHGLAELFMFSQIRRV